MSMALSLFKPQALAPAAPAAAPAGAETALATRRSSVGLQTSGKDLKQMLEKSGAQQKLAGAEKLDFLVWLADQVKVSIEKKKKMKLKLGELSSFLEREGIKPENGRKFDAKSAVSGLLALRRREIERLCYDSDRQQEVVAADQCFELALANMPADQVDSCFEGALVLYSEPGTDIIESQLPGAVPVSHSVPPPSAQLAVPVGSPKTISSSGGPRQAAQAEPSGRGAPSPAAPTDSKMEQGSSEPNPEVVPEASARRCKCTIM
eukprot:gnl/TRDRNA2_/TRDRNA2_86007_c0_seq1.p1 gnl/TRDRNA2_/TRDRNA2_86007_c0~~gnl/TRDRNA2_/TRDRNA2_86007_c0_seq1.p1  ORF type:complete len:263 (-),score=64.90 gnl/TRDRNA2_/TRDRNA2_86007_c0_seq1:66-854(-)